MSGSSSPDNGVVTLLAGQEWLGNDGPWSTFTIGVGSPSQACHIHVSTTALQPWFIAPQGCLPGAPPDCALNRGNIFQHANSSSWQPIHNFSVTPNIEANLGYSLNGEFGFDTVSLGLPGTNAPTVSSQLIAGIASTQFYVATLGIHPQATNLTDFTNPLPSLLTNMKTAGLISSISWAYTAGSFYEYQANKQSSAQLALGGYDSSLFTPSNTTFNFAASMQYDLSVGVQSISASGTELLDKPISAYIDSGVPHLWLPLSVCQRFEQHFSLTWNETLGLYLVNDTAHHALAAQDATVTFAVTNDVRSHGPNVTLVFPYGAFDLSLTADFPGVDAATRYFPLRRAANATQFTLGRAFLQHAYVVADYERQTFSVNQADFAGTGPPQLHAIRPPGNDSTTAAGGPAAGGSGLSAGAIAGIVIGVVIGLPALVLGVLFVWRRRHRRRAAADAATAESSSDGKADAAEIEGRERTEADGYLHPRVELAEKTSTAAELGAAKAPMELSNEVLRELPNGTLRELSNGDPAAAELDEDRAARELAGHPMVFELEGDK